MDSCWAKKGKVSEIVSGVGGLVVKLIGADDVSSWPGAQSVAGPQVDGIFKQLVPNRAAVVNFVTRVLNLEDAYSKAQQEHAYIAKGIWTKSKTVAVFIFAELNGALPRYHGVLWLNCVIVRVTDEGRVSLDDTTVLWRLHFEEVRKDRAVSLPASPR